MFAEVSEWQPFVPVIAALAGVFVGGLIQGLLAHWARKATAEQDRRKLHREKLEQLIEVLSEIAGAYFREAYRLIEGKVVGTYPRQVRELKPWARLLALVRIYSPHFVPDIQKLQAMGNPVDEAFRAYVAAQSSENVGPLQAAYVPMMNTFEAVQARVADHLRNEFVLPHSRRPWLWCRWFGRS